MIFAIVDIETTGGTSKSSGITEIAVVRTDGVNILDQWSSLIQPDEPIPPRIVALTGITNDMVVDAPRFEDIASTLERLLSDATFVAHNVGFDYAFIRGHFEALGQSWQRPKLCTVRLARKAIPGMPRYSLGALCDALGIEHKDRHRAMGDALATTTLFKKILESPNGPEAIKIALARGTREGWMPQHVPAKQFDALPNEPGVYWFLNESGKPLYIGMSIHIQQRVRSHFAGPSTSAKRQQLSRDMRRIHHELAGSEWMAVVMEDVRIREHWPPLNRAQKQPAAYRNVVHYRDRQGRSRLAIRANRSPHGAIKTFHSEASARAWLHDQAKDFGLNPIYLGLGDLGQSVTIEDDAHEAQFEQALLTWTKKKSGWFVERGRQPGERGLIQVEGNHVTGYGFIPANSLPQCPLHSPPGIQALVNLSTALSPVAPSSTLDARLPAEWETNSSWVECVTD